MATYRDLLVREGSQSRTAPAATSIPSEEELLALIWDPLHIADKQAILATLWRDLPWGDAPLELREPMGRPPLPDTIPEEEKPRFAGGWWDPLVVARPIIGRLLRSVSTQDPDSLARALEEGETYSWLLSQLPGIQRLWLEREVPRLRAEYQEQLETINRLLAGLERAEAELREKLEGAPELDTGFTTPGEPQEPPDLSGMFAPRGALDQPRTRWEEIVDRWIRPYFLPHAQEKVARLLVPYVMAGVETRSKAMNWAVTEAFRQIAPLIRPEDVTSEGRAMLLALWPEEYGHLR